MTDKKQAALEAAAKTAAKTVKWDDSAMQTSYANVCNVASTREEVTLLFGTNQTWHAGQSEVAVQLSNRVVLNPYAAKRLCLLLAATIKKYEDAFGEVQIVTNTDPGKA